MSSSDSSDGEEEARRAAILSCVVSTAEVEAQQLEAKKLKQLPKGQGFQEHRGKKLDEMLAHSLDSRTHDGVWELKSTGSGGHCSQLRLFAESTTSHAHVAAGLQDNGVADAEAEPSQRKRKEEKKAAKKEKQEKNGKREKKEKKDKKEKKRRKKEGTGGN